MTSIRSHRLPVRLAFSAVVLALCVATGAVAGSQSQTISGVYSRYTSYQLDGFNNTRDQHGVQKLEYSSSTHPDNQTAKGLDTRKVSERR